MDFVDLMYFMDLMDFFGESKSIQNPKVSNTLQRAHASVRILRSILTDLVSSAHVRIDLVSFVRSLVRTAEHVYYLIITFINRLSYM